MGVGGINQKKKFLFLNENICCDPSLEPSQRDGFNEGPQYMFLWGKKNWKLSKNCPHYSLLSGVQSTYSVMVCSLSCKALPHIDFPVVQVQCEVSGH